MFVFGTFMDISFIGGYLSRLIKIFAPYRKFNIFSSTMLLHSRPIETAYSSLGLCCVLWTNGEMRPIEVEQECGVRVYIGTFVHLPWRRIGWLKFDIENTAKRCQIEQNLVLASKSAELVSRALCLRAPRRRRDGEAGWVGMCWNCMPPSWGCAFSGDLK